jgi:hypothetical protein
MTEDQNDPDEREAEIVAQTLARLRREREEREAAGA